MVWYRLDYQWSYLSFKTALSAACSLLAGLGSAVGSASCSTARGPWVRYHAVQSVAFVSSFADSGRVVASSWRKYVHIVLFKGLEGQGLHRNSVVRLSYLPNMAIAV